MGLVTLVKPLGIEVDVGRIVELEEEEEDDDG